MATKKAPAVSKKRSKKAPPKRATKAASSPSPSPSPGVDDPLKTMHDAGAEGAHPEAAPSAEPVAVHREEPDEVEAEEAVAALPTTTLSAVVARAIKFAAAKEPLIRVYATLVVAVGPRGAVLIPWNAPGLEADTHVLDGKQLSRMLKAAGKDAEIHSTPEGIIIRYGGNRRRFTLRALVAEVDTPTPPSTSDPASPWVAFDPTLFHLATKFTDHRIDPVNLTGVHLGSGYLAATDRHSFLYALTGQSARPCGTLPSTSFSDINEPCYVTSDAQGRFWICVPTTGEYRMVIPFADEYPNVRHVADGVSCPGTITLDKAEFVEAVKKMATVQKKTSSVMLHVFHQANEGAFLEMRAQSPSSAAEMVVRLDVHETNLGAGDNGRAFKTFTSGENLLRLAAADLSPTTVTLRVGDTSSDPIAVEAAGHKAVVTVMRP